MLFSRSVILIYFYFYLFYLFYYCFIVKEKFRKNWKTPKQNKTSSREKSRSKTVCPCGWWALCACACMHSGHGGAHNATIPSARTHARDVLIACTARAFRASLRARGLRAVDLRAWRQVRLGPARAAASLCAYKLACSAPTGLCHLG